MGFYEETLEKETMHVKANKTMYGSVVTPSIMYGSQT